MDQHTADGRTDGGERTIIQELRTELRDLRERADQQDERIDELEAEAERKDDRIEALENEVDALETDLNSTEGKATAALKRSGVNRDRVAELQARELEKGAHLLENNLPTSGGSGYDVDVADGRLEKIQKEDGEAYLRLPESDDPLGRGGSTTLAHGDLLPIQQLAQMDDDMLHSSTSDLPSRLAAKVWKARADETVGDNPWRQGSGELREYLKASDLKHWIRRTEKGISEEYAKKLVSRTIDRLKEYSNNRLGIRKKTERKNGLNYTERRVLLTADASIPGETGAATDASPETAGVHG